MKEMKNIYYTNNFVEKEDLKEVELLYKKACECGYEDNYVKNIINSAKTGVYKLNMNTLERIKSLLNYEIKIASK